MLKKNKDKIVNSENPQELVTTQKQAKPLLDVPELFSSPDIILDDNKTLTKIENIELDSKTNIVKQVDSAVSVENSVSVIPKDVAVNKEEKTRTRKMSSRLKDNSTEINVTKTVEEILNDISSKIANQTDIIDEENLIDELADLNEDLNSVCY